MHKNNKFDINSYTEMFLYVNTSDVNKEKNFWEFKMCLFFLLLECKLKNFRMYWKSNFNKIFCIRPKTMFPFWHILFTFYKNVTLAFQYIFNVFWCQNLFIYIYILEKKKKKSQTVVGLINMSLSMYSNIDVAHSYLLQSDTKERLSYWDRIYMLENCK